MIRRRRPAREIPFSFDSFLDIVANVVGIIIRLILVVWVGARSYSSVQSVAEPATPAEVAVPEIAAVADPLQDELTRHRRELVAVQERLLAQLRRLEQAQAVEKEIKQELESVSRGSRDVGRELETLQKTAVHHDQTAQAAALSSAQLGKRSQKLVEEIRALEKMPVPQKVLRYRTPISRPVQSEELLFECKNGRITFIDIAALLTQVRDNLDDQTKLLRSQWQIHGVTGTVGAFRLRYTLERERNLLDSMAPEAPPPSTSNFSAGLSEWQIEPIAPERGETSAGALLPGSEFRQIVDGIDPRQTAVTFWVYPDSFALYRQLRDYLYERDVTVAGRPLPDHVLIASSRRGSVSRGQ